MRIAALTGNYGMGKSFALREFEALGAFTISADEVVAQLLTKPQILQNIRPILGDSVFDPDGSLDKKKAAEVMFDDDEKLQQMEELLHPLVFKYIDLRIDEIRKKMEELTGSSAGGLVIVEVPLLFEGNYRDRFDKVVTIYTEVTTALNRLQEAGVSREEAAMRLQHQIPVEEKIPKSDLTIDNNGTPESARRSIKYVYEVLKS
jgi:dephospho-CoA kinase